MPGLAIRSGLAGEQVRSEVIQLDNMTTGKAVDALLNYETVKLYGNEQLEVDEYDEYLVRAPPFPRLQLQWFYCNGGLGKRGGIALVLLQGGPRKEGWNCNGYIARVAKERGVGLRWLYRLGGQGKKCGIAMVLYL